jgi:hypothetical protein
VVELLVLCRDQFAGSEAEEGGAAAGIRELDRARMEIYLAAREAVGKECGRWLMEEIGGVLGEEPGAGGGLVAIETSLAVVGGTDGGEVEIERGEADFDVEREEEEEDLLMKTFLKVLDVLFFFVEKGVKTAPKVARRTTVAVERARNAVAEEAPVEEGWLERRGRSKLLKRLKTK